MTDIPQIAARLSVAEGCTILKMPSDTKFRTAKQIGATGRVLTRLMDACRDGIEPPVALIERDYVDYPRLSWAYRLSPLGVSVAQYLRSQANG